VVKGLHLQADSRPVTADLTKPILQLLLKCVCGQLTIIFDSLFNTTVFLTHIQFQEFSM